MAERSTAILRDLIEVGLGGSKNPSPHEVASADWTQTTASARRHLLSGLLFKAIRNKGLSNLLPPETWATLQADHYTHLARNLVLLNHAEELIDSSRRSGAPLFFLKGAAFAGWLYGNPALRPMTDLDILVREQDIEALAQTALKLGYELFERTSHAISFRHRLSGTYLELHTSLTSCPSYVGIGVEELLARSIPTSTRSDSVRTLAPEDHLLHLCLHCGFQHGFRQPAINACDTYLLAQRPELDWERFFERGSQPRIAPFVYGGLRLSTTVLPSTKLELALETLETKVRPRHKRRFRRLDIARLLSPSSESSFGAPWSRFHMAPSFEDMWSLVKETLSPIVMKPSSPGKTIARGVTLVYRHGFSRWSRSLGSPRTEVRTET